MAPDTQMIAPVPDMVCSGQTGSFCTILSGSMSRHWPKVLPFFLCRCGYQSCLASEVESRKMQGFSPRNLKYMRKFAEVWPDVELVQRSVALIPWSSNMKPPRR
jgi:hypothetical protein